MSKTLLGAATLMGSIIGAGILGVPYVFAKAGLFLGLVHLLGIGALLLTINLFLGEVTLRTKGDHELTGYAYRYLGRQGSIIVAIALIIQVYGALVAYTIGQGVALTSMFGGNPFIYSIIFYLIFSYLAHRGLASVGKSELFLTGGIVAVIILVSIFSLRHFEASNITLMSSNYLLPYGVVLFALSGFTTVPLVKELLIKEKKNLRKAIIIGSVIPIAIYLLFAIAVMGVIGISGFEALTADQRIASVALQLTLGGPIAYFTNIFAMLAMATSFLAVFTVLKETFTYDFNISSTTSFWLTFSLPLLIFLLNAFYNLTDFIGILGFVGAIGGSIMGIMIVLMHHKARMEKGEEPAYKIKSNSILSIFLVIIFLFGILSVLI